ncbi:hypothetical protein SERLA73DRAFT_72413 [Serpula lacrymans var. lacrymans S7.3]|uniref:Mtf2-like C-terminal domain-containing protein n=1 Tax=Serpula lacrymans var. lacrymans (strain S7.3) TaxID=936435 RepID=F8PTY6_SERL3|nr:hypothetical protein SERLA73DRAFT_72413 [Serpula lacrymans var. lacrymans S7.3]
MLACRRLLPYTSFLERSFQRASSTNAPSGIPSSSQRPDSIFSKSESAWDHVFSDIKEMPPLLPSTVRNPLRANASESPASGRTRRQAMTAREISAFDDMFNTIFNAVSEQKAHSGDGSKAPDPLSTFGIGRSPQSGQMGDLLGKLRRHSKRLKWTSESDEELDRKKEEMDLCDTDHQLLEWALAEVFGESKRYEEAARKAISSGEQESPPMLQSSTYPHLVALLIRSFRDKYHDPHLALSIFEYARHLSIPSYVFGCTTPAYNELIETRWTCFRDLKGVHDALEEMRVNGIEPDNRTRKLVEALRREVGERNLWEEESSLGSGGMWSMLSKIEQLVRRESKKRATKQSLRRKKWVNDDEAWKNAALNPDKADGWEFDQWDSDQVKQLSTTSSNVSKQGMDGWLNLKQTEDKLDFR